MSAVDDWDGEQEVDFRRYWEALLARWWLPLVGLVAGAIVGYLISLGGGQVYQAQTTVYLGQPYSASGNIQLQSLQTNPSTVRQIVTSQSSVVQAAHTTIAVAKKIPDCDCCGQLPSLFCSVRKKATPCAILAWCGSCVSSSARSAQAVMAAWLSRCST